MKKNKMRLGCDVEEKKKWKYFFDNMKKSVISQLHWWIFLEIVAFFLMCFFWNNDKRITVKWYKKGNTVDSSFSFRELLKKVSYQIVRVRELRFLYNEDTKRDLPLHKEKREEKIKQRNKGYCRITRKIEKRKRIISLWQKKIKRRKYTNFVLLINDMVFKFDTDKFQNAN